VEVDTMTQLTLKAAVGRITRIDGDFIQLESGYAFWLEPTLPGTQGIMLGDMVALMYDVSTMKVTAIRKADKHE
jgi:hypothetical protein